MSDVLELPSFCDVEVPLTTILPAAQAFATDTAPLSYSASLPAIEHSSNSKLISSMKPTPHLGRATCLRFGVVRALAASAAGLNRAPVLSTQVELETEPIVMMGDEAVLESWGIFRLDSATRNPPKHLLQELNAAGCRYDDALRGWTVDEELEANPDGSFTRSWSGVSRGSGPELFVPAPDVQQLIDRSFHEATSPDALSVAATWHFDRLRQKVRDINSRIDAEYRSQVAAAVERGSATWADARVEVPDNLPDIDSIFNRQSRRRAERVRRKAERRQRNSASCNIAEQPELDEPTLPSIADPVQPIAFAAERVEIDEWCEFNLRCRTPKAVAAGSDVLILPLEDERAKSLDFLVAPALCRVDESGYVVIRCLNPHRRKINVSLLSQVARFVVDPRISGADLEFTTDEIVERINLPTDLSPEELQYVRAMISQRRRLFATTLGWAHGYKQKIDTPLIDSGAVPPPAFPMRNRPPGEWAILKEFVDKQLAQRLIEPCISPYNAVPMCVKKPDGTYRVVIDLRALNALTKRDVYPLPNIQANLNKLGKAHWFTAVDLLMGFHQCELEEEAKIKTAFGTPWGQMCYTRMPMGLTSSPSAFMRLVDAALRGLPSEVVTPYVDDILISTGGTFKEHIDTVSAVFEKLVAAGFTVKCEKVHIGMRECSYLGFLVGAYGTRPEAKKTKPIFDMTYERLRSDPSAPGRFAGMIGFYRKFLDHASSMLASFDDLKSKEGQAMHDDIVDSLRFRAAFESLKHALSHATALARPDFNKPFYIDVDASTVNGIGAALSQRMDETDPTTHYPVSFYSRRFDSTERGYPVRDQECMGLTEAVTEWRPYVLGNRTIVRTDHKSLRWLMTCQHPDGSRVANWALNIQEYGVEIEYIPGKEHVVADCLSRAVAEAVGIHSESFSEEGPFTDTPCGPAIKVSTMNGSRQPAKLMKLGVCDFQRRPIPGIRIETNIIDSGSGAEIMGLADFHWLSRVAPACIRRRDAPLASSLERILGVGQGQSGVYCHAELMLSFGGKAIYCEDIAVLVHHKGVLLGNDTLDSSRAVISYNGNCEGHVRLRDSSLKWCSDAVPFSVARNSSAPCFTVGAIETFTPYLGHLPSHDPLTNLIQHFVLVASSEPLGTKPLSAPSQDLVSILAITPSLHILAERQSGVVSLPTVQVTSNLRNGLACRKRLANHWSDCFGPSSEISLRLLDGSSSSITSPTKLSSSCRRYMVVVVDDVQFLSSIQHMLPGHEAVVLDRNSCMDVDDNDNREFIATFLRSLHRSHPVHRLHHTRSWRIDHLRPVFRRLRTLRGGENKGGKIKHKLQQSTSRHHAAIAAFYSPTSSACTAEVAVIDLMQPQLEGRVPRLSDKPNGPALCKSRAEIVEACKRLYFRLKANPSQVLAVDLEGELGGPRSYISKIQLAVDGDDHGPALVYVIDSHYNSPAIAIDAPMSLKSILEDDTIVKVIHHCRGDTGALFYQYGIVTRNVFDTALADCLLQHRHFNSSRNLETVLTESLGHHAVHLNFKGKLIHTPRMFEEEPLPIHLFVYAYEDVVFLGALYATLKDRLQGCGKGELHHSLTQCRIPPRALPQGHPGFQPAERIAVAVLDHQHVVCVQSKADAVYTLPIADIGKNTTRTHIGLKKRASEIWSATMGKPPKHVAAAVNAKLRSPTRLSAEDGRDVLLYETRLDNCVLRLSSMEMSFSTRSIANEADIVLRRRDSIALITNDCDSELHASFQFIDPAFGEVQRHNAIKLVSENSEPMPTVTPLIRLNIRPTSGSSVSTSLAFTDCPAANSVTSEPAATVCIVTGRTISDKRAALILHDSSSAFAISTNLKGARVAWPSTPVMVGEDPAEAAIRAFDIFAGPSLRKGSDSSQPSRWALSPLVGTTINADIMRGMRQLNTDSTEFGNTIYFAVKFSGVQTQDTSVRVKFNVAASGVKVELITDPGCKFPTLLDCSSAIHASRRECNGFRLVNTLKNKHKSAGLLDTRPTGDDTNSRSLHPTTPQDGPSKPEPLGTSDLSSYDAAALKALQSDPEPQSPTSATVFALLSTVALAFHENEPDTSELPAVRASLSHESDGGANDAADFLPSVGEDPEFDKLFLAYVTIAAGSADLLPTPPPPSDCPDCSEPDSDDADVRNTVYAECRHGFVVVEGEHWDPEITPICHRRGCARRALRWWQRNRDFIRQSDAAAEEAEAQEPVISESGVSRVVSTAGQRNAFCVYAEGSHRNVRFVNASARASDLDADSIGKAPQAGDSPPSFRDILSEQRVHPATSGLVHFLLTNDALEDCGHDRSELESLAKHHSLDDNGVLVYNSGAALELNRIVLPPRFHVWCCRQFHDRQGHFGVARTLDHISHRYTWGSEAQMKRDVQQYINRCRVCARTKMGRHPMGEGIIGDHGNHPMDILDTDVYKVGYKSSTGEDTIISFADHFSKAVFARARVGDPTSEQFAETLIDTIISHYGVPRAIRSDHASVLISHAIRHLYQIYGIKMADGKPYMHRSIGLVERWHSTLKHLLLSVRLSTGSDDWHKFLPLLQLAFNSAVASATGYSPFFLNHLRHPVLPIDNISTTRSHLKVEDMPDWVSQSLDQLQVSFDAVNQRLKVRALKAKKIWDLKHDVVTSFSPGDLVLVVKGSVIDGNHPKGEEPMHGPYTVRRRLARDNYQLADLRNNRLHDEFPISRLRPYPSRRLRSEDSELYPVQAIVGHRIRKVPINAKGSLAPMAGQSLVEYRIRWSGFSKSYDSFRSAQFLSDAFDLVSAYREMRRQKGLSPLPDEDPSPELEDHAIGQPEVDPDAKRKPRFRADPSSMREPSVTLPDRQAGRSDPQSSGDHIGTSSLDDIFPVGTRVQVRYSDGWWTGTVCETYVSKATSKRPSERRLVIQYDSKEYKDELWEHGLRGTLVRCLAQGESPSPQIAPPLAPIVLPVPPSSLEPVRCDAGLVTNARQQGGRWEYLVTSTGRKGVQRERFLPASAFTSTELESFSCFRQPAPPSSAIESHSDDRGVSEIADSHDAHPPGIFSRAADRDDPVLPLAATGLGRRSSACEEADAVSGRSGNSRRARRPRISRPQRPPVESEPRSDPEPTVIGIGAILQLQQDIPGSADSVATRTNDADVTHRNSDQLSRLAHIFAPQPSAAAYLSCLNLVVPAVRTLDGRLFNILHTLHLPGIEDSPNHTVVATRSRISPISSAGTVEVAVIDPMQPQMEGRPRRLSDNTRSRISQHIAEMEANGLIHRSVSPGDSLGDIPRNSSRFSRLEAVMPTFESAARLLVADFGARIAAAQTLDPTTRTLIEWIQSGRRRHPSFQEHVLERREVPVEYTVNSNSAVQIPSYSGCGVTFILSRDQRPSSSGAVYVSQPADSPIQFYRIPAEHSADAADPQAYELVQDTDLVVICSVVTHCQQGGYVPGRIINCTDDTILVPPVTATIRVDKAVGSLYKPPWVRQCELVGDLLCFRETGRTPNIWGGRAPEPSRELHAPDRLLPVVPVCCRAHEIRRFHDVASTRRVAEAWDDFRLSVWWPTISKDIWSHVHMCHECTFATNRCEPFGEILVLPDLLPRRGPTLHMGLSFNDLFQACDVELHHAHNLVTQDQHGYCLGCRRPFRSVEIGWPMTCPGCNGKNFMIGCAAFPQDYIERNVILSWCHEYFMAYAAKLESPFKHRRRWLRAGVFVICYLRLMRCYAVILERRLAPGGAGYLDALNEFDDLLLGFPSRPPSPSHCDISDATLFPSASDLRAEEPVERGRSITQASSLCDSASQLDSSNPLQRLAIAVESDRHAYRRLADVTVLYYTLTIPALPRPPAGQGAPKRPVVPSLGALHSAHDLLDALTLSHDLPPSSITDSMAKACGVNRPLSSTHRAIAASAYRVLHPSLYGHGCSLRDVPSHLRASTRCMVAWHVALSLILPLAMHGRSGVSNRPCLRHSLLRRDDRAQVLLPKSEAALPRSAGNLREGEPTGNGHSIACSSAECDSVSQPLSSPHVPANVDSLALTGVVCSPAIDPFAYSLSSPPWWRSFWRW